MQACVHLKLSPFIPGSRTHLRKYLIIKSGNLKELLPVYKAQQAVG
jgi:hypothetical protein